MKRLIGCAVLVLAMACGAFAQSVEVMVTQITASGSGGEVKVDPKLAELAGVLPRQFRFSNYAFVSRTSSAVSSEHPATWTLTGGKYLEVALGGVSGQGATARYTIMLRVYSKTSSGEKTILKLTQKVAKGKSSLVGVGGDPGGTLILAIKAR